MEYIDILNDNGVPTGETKSRPEIHRNGDWHRAVHVWIVNNRNEVLIQKRSAIIDLFQNLWDVSLAGHVLSGEKSDEAARRELKEEFDIAVEKDDLILVGTMKSQLQDRKRRDNQFCDIYLLRRGIDLNGIKKQKSEVADVALVPLEDLKERVRESPERFVPRTEEYEKMFNLLAS